MRQQDDLEYLVSYVMLSLKKLFTMYKHKEPPWDEVFLVFWFGFLVVFVCLGFLVVFGFCFVLSCRKAKFLFLCYLLHDHSNFRKLFEKMYFFPQKVFLKGS